jgi:hypothetical protein
MQQLFLFNWPFLVWSLLLYRSECPALLSQLGLPSVTLPVWSALPLCKLLRSPQRYPLSLEFCSLVWAIWWFFTGFLCDLLSGRCLRRRSMRWPGEWWDLLYRTLEVFPWSFQFCMLILIQFDNYNSRYFNVIRNAFSFILDSFIQPFYHCSSWI